MKSKTEAMVRKYTRDEVMSAASEYLDGDQLAASVWVNKYALKDSEGNLYERTPEDMHRRIAGEIARIESKYPNPMSEDEVFDLIDRFKFIVPQGSPMAGIGNSMQLTSLSNCFVIGNPEGSEDSYGAILRTDEKQIQLMKRRSGVGHDLSGIRPAGMRVNNAAVTSTGIVPFMERYSNSTREVAQGGRRGALMLTVSVRHPEAEAFIDAKLDTTKVTGANVSVKIHDDFMRSVESGSPYRQQWPIDAADPVVSTMIDPSSIWKKIVHNAWKSAEPGILWWDRITEESPADCYSDIGFKTISTNPCGELPLCSGDSCRLLAINLLSYVIDPWTKEAKFDWSKFEEHVEKAQRMMDDIIDLELEKVSAIIAKVKKDPESRDVKRVELEMWEEIHKKCTLGRRTGTGVTAEGDMLAALGLRYGTKQATEFAEKVHKRLALRAYRSSVTLAKERGAFEAYDPQKELNNPFLNRLRQEDPELGALMSEYGRRNIALLTIAPTGSVSILTKTTSGIECAYLVAYTRRKKVNPNDKGVKVAMVDAVGDAWEEYAVFHHGFRDWMVANGYDPEASMTQDQINAIIEKSPYYKAMSNDVDWVEKVRMQGAVQKWIDHSISVTVNLPESATEDTVASVYMESWRAGCKGCTVYRDGSRTGVLVSNDKKQATASEFPDTAAPKRPKKLDATVTRFSNAGGKWIGFIGVLDGRPYELFTGDLDDFPVPAYVESGHIVKEKVTAADGTKRSAYHFEYEDKTGSVIRMPNLNHAFDERYYDMARTLSAILRHGMPIPYVIELIEGLRLDGELINTWKAGVKRMLKKYVKDGTKVAGKACQDCGSTQLEYKEGCMTCTSCGSSKCG